MGLIYPGIPQPIVNVILEYFPIKYFIETGTYRGESASWASEHFEKVFTIEKSQELWVLSKEKYQHRKNIEFLLGDSREKLRDALSQIDTPALIWLDAHWSGGKTYGEGDECALLDELGVICAIPKDHFILIDDARLFSFPPPHPYSPTQWPTISEVISLLDKAGLFSVIIDDVLVAVPTMAKVVMLQYYQDLATERWEQHLAQGQVVHKPSLLSRIKKWIDKLSNRLKAILNYHIYPRS